MGIAGTFYRLVGRRFSTTLAIAAGGVFVFDFAINKGGDAIWNSINEGKQWKDIKPQLLQLQREAAALRESEEAKEAESTEEETVKQAAEPDNEKLPPNSRAVEKQARLDQLMNSD